MNKHNTIEAILRDYSVIILDGGLATELERKGCDLNDPLWSARVLLENPEMIYQVHTDYFHAGSDCAITASYQATIAGFSRCGIQEKDALELIKNTVILASKARDDFWKDEMAAFRPKPLIAGSIGPYGAYLSDGSEYIGTYGVTDEILLKFHRTRMAALIEAGVDLFAFETIPSLQEAKVLSTLLKEFPQTNAWLSFSLKNDHAISDGTLLEECAQIFEENNQIVAIGINCAPASFITSAINVLSANTEKPIVVYPNSGESYDPGTKTWSGQNLCSNLDAISQDWFNLGARLIGGCCRTGPEHIRQISGNLRPAAAIATCLLPEKMPRQA